MIKRIMTNQLLSSCSTRPDIVKVVNLDSHKPLKLAAKEKSNEDDSDNESGAIRKRKRKARQDKELDDKVCRGHTSRVTSILR